MGCMESREELGSIETPLAVVQKPIESKADSGLVPRPFQHSGKTVYHYFDVFGRGEVIRMLLHLTKVPFEDHRFGFEEWLKLKQTAEFGVCPILEIDGHHLAQTKAIIRYVAQLHGLYPSGPNDVYKLESFIDEVCDIREDLIEHSAHQLLDKLAEHYAKMPTLLLFLEKRLVTNPSNSGWVIGPSMTLADLFLFNLLWDWFLCPDRKVEHAQKVPKRLKEFADFFLSRNPRMKEYVETRQPRPF